MRDTRSKSHLLAAVVAAGLLAAVSAQAMDITGAGATFPYPIYAKWAEAYRAKTGVGLNYQSIGSGGGIKQIQNKTVDFGASDMPMKPEELDKDGLLQFPTVIGGDVPVMNLEGVGAGQLKLTGPMLADIYLGKITKWNDAAITKLNPTLKMPDSEITVVHRSDGSGTTFIYTDYLSNVSPDWKTNVGNASSVQWPVGLGGKGNEGVAGTVQQNEGSIGYVELAYAIANKMNYAQMQNRDGAFVSPSADTFKAAAAGADWSKAPGYYLVLTEQPGKNSWPISGATFILMYKSQTKSETAKEVLKFFDWAYSPEGDKLAGALDYVPLPDAVTNQIRTTWKSQIKDASGKPVF